MVPEFVHGAIAPVFTAFDPEGRFDENGQRAILDHLVETHAVSAYFVRSGLGQMYTFDENEVRRMAEVACSHMQGRGPVLVGTTGIWNRDRSALPDPVVFTKQAVELSKFAVDQGAAAVVHTMPEAIAPKEGQLCSDVVMAYFETINNAVSVPILIYQPPGTDPRYCVTDELVQRLADLPNIKGMKLSTNDAEYISEINYALTGRDFGFIAGAETAFLAALVCGARACIGQGATINPAIIKAVQERFSQGDLQGAIEAQHSVNLLVKKSPHCVVFYKRWIAEKGYVVHPYQRPTDTQLYGTAQPQVTQEEYNSFKCLLEGELGRYA